MKYHVEWLRSARDQLADAWIDADSASRSAITAATDNLERLLSRQPADIGESRELNERVCFVEPLFVRFAVEVEADSVTVLDVRVYRKRS